MSIYDNEAQNKLGLRIYDRVDEIEYIEKDGSASYATRTETVKYIDWCGEVRFNKLDNEWLILQEHGDPLEHYQYLENKYQALCRIAI